MNTFAYHRATAEHPDPSIGIQDILTFAHSQDIKLSGIYQDIHVGSAFDLTQYEELKSTVLKPGDILIIKEPDLLGRLKKDVVAELRYFKENQIRLLALSFPTTLIDASRLKESEAREILKVIEDLMLEIYSHFSDEEAKRRSRNQRRGIESMKENGEWERYGRKRLMTLEEFGREYQVVINGELKPFELMHKLNMKTPTFYKYRDEYLRLIGKK